MEQEYRSFDSVVTAGEDTRHVEGYAMVFNTLSRDLGGFRETISPEAISDVLERSDVMALLNHKSERGILARSRYGKGSLELTVDETGLMYSFEAPRTALGDECLEYLRRGDISQSSFAFTVAEDKWEKQGDGSYIRTITKFDRLFDVSPVFEPAYEATSVKCARFAEIQEEERLENERLMREAEAREAEEKAEAEKAEADRLEAYYNDLREKYLK